MGAIERMLKDVPLPRMARVRQCFNNEKISDVGAAVREQLDRPGIAETIRPGMRIAITAGSRGVANYPLVLREIAGFVKRAGAVPFVVPCMGSHGGATAEGQLGVLRSLGVTEESVGVPIQSSMEVSLIGTFPDGTEVCADRLAASADGIIALNRIKPHTTYRGPYQSGLMKMLAVGMGKREGADRFHQSGPACMAENVERFGRMLLEKLNIICGVALVENGYDETCIVRALTPREIIDHEPHLLEEAVRRMPRILLQPLDVMVVDRIGKDIGGPGMDPNISGTFIPESGISREHRAKRIAVLDLTDATHGCAIGAGMADFGTQRLFEKFDFEMTYPNCLTAGIVDTGKMPIILKNQRLAIQAAVKTAQIPDITAPRLVRIPNTLHIGEIEISEALLPEALAHPDIEVLEKLYPFSFNKEGDLF